MGIDPGERRQSGDVAAVGNSDHPLAYESFPTAGDPVKGSLVAAAIGLVGAVVWAGIAVSTGYEIGWIAWGVGVGVGFGMRWGSGGASNQLGVLAAVIAFVTVVGARVVTIAWIIGLEFLDMDMFIATLNPFDALWVFLAVGSAFKVANQAPDSLVDN